MGIFTNWFSKKTKKLDEILHTIEKKASSPAEMRSKARLDNLDTLNGELNKAVADTKEISTKLISKLNGQVDSLSKQVKVMSGNMLDGIISIDYRGVITGFNPSAQKVFGYKASDIYGQNINKLIPMYTDAYNQKIVFDSLMETISIDVFNNLKIAENTPRADTEFLAANTTLSEINNLIRRKADRTPIYIEATINVVDLHVQRVEDIRYFCIVRDVTELIASKRVVDKLVNFQMSLVEALPHPIYWIDRQFKYAGCNAAFEKLLGLDKEVIIGKTFDSLLEQPGLAAHPSTDFIGKERELRESIQMALNSKNGAFKKLQKRHVFESTIIDGGGKIHNVVMYRHIISTEMGEFDGLVCTMVDITKFNNSKLKAHFLRYDDSLLIT